MSLVSCLLHDLNERTVFDRSRLVGSLRLFAKYMKGGELLNLGFTPDS